MAPQGTPQQRARRLIDGGKHMTVATADPSGVPWVSPVFYVRDDEYDLYWVSARAARHSQNIRDNPNVPIVIYQTEAEVDAVYISAQAHELSDADDVRRAIEIVGRRPQLDKWAIGGIEDVTGSGPWRIYRAAVESIEVRLPAEEGGKAIVTRERADFRRE